MRDIVCRPGDWPLIPRNRPQGVLQVLAQSLPLRVGSLPWDANRFFQDHFTARKRQWNLKSIPAFWPPLPMKMIGERNDRQPGDLGERHHPILHYITWPARSIRRNRQVITALGPRRQLEHRLWPAPARGAAHGLDVERFQDRREESAVLAGADHRRHPGAAAAFSGVAKVSPHRQRQPVMPNAEDYR